MDWVKTLVIILLLTSILVPIAITSINTVLPAITGKHLFLLSNNGIQPLGDGDEFKFPWLPG